MIRRFGVSAAALTLGVAFVTPTSALAADDAAVVDSIVGGVFDVLDVSAEPGFISDVAAELTPDMLDPALVSEVARALDANQNGAAAAARSFDTDGDGEISGTERAALTLVSLENWRALEAVLAAHNSDDDDADDEGDDPSPAGNAGAGVSNPGNNSSNGSDDDEDESDEDDSRDDPDDEDEEDESEDEEDD